MKVSVIVPVYNSSPFLWACLESIEAQTCQDFEVICVDDGSDDDSPSLLEQAAQRWENVRVIALAHAGVSHARNAGIEAAQGDYLLFVDSDDLIKPTLLETCLQAAIPVHAQMTIFGFSEYFSATDTEVPRELCEEEGLYGHTIRLADMEGVSTSLLTPNSVRILFERKFIEDHHLRFHEDLRTSEDLAFIYEALIVVQRIYLLRDRFYLYRRDGREVSLTHQDRGLAGFRALRYIDEASKKAGTGSEDFQRHFINLILDVAEYALVSAAHWDEFQALFYSFQSDWLPLVLAHEAMVVERYRFFLGNIKRCQTASEYLWILFDLERGRSQRLLVDIATMNRELDELRAYRDAHPQHQRSLFERAMGRLKR